MLNSKLSVMHLTTDYFLAVLLRFQLSAGRLSRLNDFFGVTDAIPLFGVEMYTMFDDARKTNMAGGGVSGINNRSSIKSCSL